MLKLILATSVALYAAFVIWGKPDATQAVAPAPEVDALGRASDANFDTPVILSQAGGGATVASAAVTATVVPDAARIAAESPEATGGQGERRIGDPVVISLVRPAAGGAQDAADAPSETSVAADPDPEGLLRVTGTAVNMRSGPSTGAEVVDSLPQGTLAEPLGAETDGWIEIRDVASGLTGFMSARFLDPA